MILKEVFTLNVNICEIFSIKGTVTEINPITDHDKQQLLQSTCTFFVCVCVCVREMKTAKMADVERVSQDD